MAFLLRLYQFYFIYFRVNLNPSVSLSLSKAVADPVVDLLYKLPGFDRLSLTTL